METGQRSSPIADSFATRFKWLGARTPREHVTIGIILLIFGVVAFGISPWLALFTVTSGLLLLTNDNDFAKRIANPESKVPKTYLVKTSTLLTDDDLAPVHPNPEVGNDAKILTICGLLPFDCSEHRVYCLQNLATGDGILPTPQSY